MEFQPFPKIARLSREVYVTEKLDGSNASVMITPYAEGQLYTGSVAQVFSPKTAETFVVYAGSRSRWVQPEGAGPKGCDNFGFAAWVRDHADELVEVLGEGQHFGEWWGQGIQRNYGLNERRFSLFNTKRWGTHYNDQGRVGPCHVVPTLYKGSYDEMDVEDILWKMQTWGSIAAPGFPSPEGVVIYHAAANQLFKKTLEKDEEPKRRPRDIDGNAEPYPGATETTMGGR